MACRAWSLLPLAAAALLLLLLAAAAGPALACTTIMAGRGATADGSMYLARTVDYLDPTVSNKLVHHAARGGPARFASNWNSFSTELPGPGLAYLAAPSTLTQSLGGSGLSLEEVGVNSAGVVVSATETIAASAAALAADPLNEDSGINEDAIVSVLLPHPRATSARATVQLLGELIEEHGSSEGFGVLIADAGESWYLENAASHHWLAQRIPDAAFFASANQHRFQEVDLKGANKDGSALLASEGLQEFAVAAGLWGGDSDAPFNFFRAFASDTAVDASANYPRVRAVQALLGGYNHTAADAFAPVFLPPAKPLQLGDVMAGLRLRYNGTTRDPYAQQTPAAPLLDGTPGEPWRPVALLTTGLAHVTRMRPPSDALPPGLSVVHYLSFGTPAWTPFVPIYRGLPPAALPSALTSVAYGSVDTTTLFWKSRRLSALLFEDWPRLGPPAEAAVAAFDARIEADERPAMEQRYTAAVAAGDEAAAERELAAFTRDAVAQARALMDKLALQAAKALGRGGLPSDAEAQQLLKKAASAYAFEF